MSVAPVDFERVVEECRAGGLNNENATRLARAMAHSFGVRLDEVGILRIEGQYLVFVHPAKLRNVAAIPLNATHSVAAQTVSSSRPQIMNNFAMVRHTTLFEAVPLSENIHDRSSCVIQKLMSVPIQGAKGPIGVIQVSRKGSSPQQAGADFTFTDLQKLMGKAGALVKLM